ncbi:MAG TPA: hypothetical protein PKD45_09365 [Flavobacteriales bacterium]|nr:hypothetical protein [Flavobacteriales bacterium]
MRTLTVVAAVLLGTAANAQYWRALGKGVVGPTGVQTLYGDSASDRLLAGGTFLHILNADDTVLGHGQATWNGHRWDSLATRIQPFSGGEGANQTHWFIRFEGQLYACGFFGFQLPNGEWNNNLARLNEQEQRWENLGCNISYLEGITTLVPKEPQGTLYATGRKGSLCGLPQSCVFRYDGEQFHEWPPFQQITYDPSNYVGTVFDYKGMTYMTCAVPDPLGPGFVSFLRWNGSSWEHVPGWNTTSPIKEILIRNDILYVAGTFTLANGGPGNLVAAFDGEAWDDMGGGLFYTPVPMAGAALDLEWFHDELWACGLFNTAGGVPARGIAKWDGHRWCVPPGDFRWINNSQGTLLDMTVWRDSLYVCGGILTVDGDTMKQVVQWLGGDAVEACSPGVGLAEIPEPEASGNLRAIPLGTPGRWTVQFPGPGNWAITAWNAAGQPVGRWQSRGGPVEVDLSGHAAGLYLLQAAQVDGRPYFAKVIRP